MREAPPKRSQLRLIRELAEQLDLPVPEPPSEAEARSVLAGLLHAEHAAKRAGRSARKGHAKRKSKRKGRG